MTLPPHFGSDPRVDALAPGIDDLANAQGLGAPAIILGTVYGHLAAGVTLGAGQSTATQTATLAGLQAALNKAGSLGKYFELEPNTYEIYGANGLVVSASSAPPRWKGCKGSILSQFYVNAPILTLGDITGATTLYGFVLDGVGLQYGVSQLGQTLANALLCGDMAWCTVEQVEVTPNGSFPIVNPSWNAFAVLAPGTWFNNTVRNSRLYGGQNTLFNLGTSGSGNLFEDIYMSNGGNDNASLSYYGACAQAGLYIGNSSYSSMSGNVFIRINVESVKAPNLITLQEASSITFEGLHVENCQINQAGGAIVNSVQGSGEFIDMDTYDIRTVAGGTACVFLMSGSGEVISVNGLSMGWSPNCDPGLLSPLQVFGINGNNDQNVMIDMRCLILTDDSNTNAPLVTLDPLGAPLTQGAAYDTQVLGYRTDQVRSETDRYAPTISANYTHYGYHSNAILMIPSSLSAATTITLSNKRIPTGLGSSLATPTGNTVRIRRTSGTYANALTVKDAQSGSTLTTNTASGVDLLYTFNGTNWVVAT